MSAQVHRFAILYSPVVITLVVGVLYASMLAAFHQVVLGAVQQAELRHKTNAVAIEAAWRCNAARPPLVSSCASLAKVGAGLTAGLTVSPQTGSPPLPPNNALNVLPPTSPSDSGLVGVAFGYSSAMGFTQ